MIATIEYETVCGKICVTMMRTSEIPIVFAANTYSRCFKEIAMPRMTLAKEAQPMKEKITTTKR